MNGMQTRWAVGVLALCLAMVMLTGCGRNRGEETAPTAAPPAPEATTASESGAVEAPESDTSGSDTTEADTAEPDTGESDAGESDTAAPASSDSGSGEPMSIVRDAMLAQLSGGPYRATTTIDAEGTVTEMVAEVIPPDTMHVTIGGGNMELIMLDDTLWSKSGESPWMQMGGTQMMEGIMDAMRGQADAENLINVQLVGSEPVFGVQTDVYTFSSVMGEGEGTISSDVKLWVAQESGLPVRMESSSVANGMTTTAIQTIEYDDSITITAPTP